MKEDHRQKKTTKLFKSQFLERLSRVNPLVAILYNLTCMSSLLFVNYKLGLMSNFWLSAAVFFLGFVSWTLAEYLLHRFFFHITEKQSPFFAKIAHTIHGIHHDYPNDYSRLFMPPVPATLFMGAFFAIFYLIMGTAVFVFLPGFLLGYLCYAYTHFKIHQAKAPKKLKWLWTHHLKHHYQDENKAFGVSSPFWDMIFQSLPSKSCVKSQDSQAEKEG